MTKSEALLEGMHKILALTYEDDKRSSEGVQNFLQTALADLSDADALQVVCQALAIEAATCVHLQKRLSIMGN